MGNPCREIQARKTIFVKASINKRAEKGSVSCIDNTYVSIHTRKLLCLSLFLCLIQVLFFN